MTAIIAATAQKTNIFVKLDLTSSSLSISYLLQMGHSVFLQDMQVLSQSFNSHFSSWSGNLGIVVSFLKLRTGIEPVSLHFTKVVFYQLNYRSVFYLTVEQEFWSLLDLDIPLFPKSPRSDVELQTFPIVDINRLLAPLFDEDSPINFVLEKHPTDLLLGILCLNFINYAFKQHPS